MSNSGLPITGIQYVISADTVNASVNQIVGAHQRIEQAQGRATARAESFDKAINANGRSMRIFASEALSSAGVSGQLSTALLGLLSATGPVSIALVALGAGLAYFKNASEQFKALNDELAKVGAGSEAAQQLVKLTGVSQSTAEAALSYAKSNQEVAASFAKLIQAAQPAVPILGGLGAALQASGEIANGVNQTLERTVIVYGAVHATILQLSKDLPVATSFAAAYADAIARGHNPLEAYSVAVSNVTAAQKAQRDAAIAATDATNAAAAANEASSANFKKAGSLASSIIQQSQALNASYARDTAAAYDQYRQTLVDIDARGAQQRAQITRQGAQQRAAIELNYARQLVDIEQNLTEGRANAARDLAERIADAETNAQEQRANLAQTFADRLISIEQSYQDQVKGVKEQYADAAFDATSRGDARALIAAQRARDQGLRNAEEQRKKDTDAANKDREKAQRDLEAALAKQKAQLEKDYEKRLRDLAEAAAKQRTKAAENENQALDDQQKAEAQQLADQATAQAEQKKQEETSYKERLKALAQSFSDRRDAIGEALGKEVELFNVYGPQLKAALQRALNPADFAAIINAANQQLQRQITLTISPYITQAPGVYGPPLPPPDLIPGMAEGGYERTGGLRMLHADEWVIPSPVHAGMDRFQHVIDGFSSHYANRLVPMRGYARDSMAAGQGGFGGSLEVKVNGRVTVSGDALSSQVEVMVGRELSSIVRDAFAKGAR